MTLTTYRSPAARALHATLELAARLRGSLRQRRQRPARPQALHVLDDAALRDLGLVHAEFESYGAEARGEAPSSYLRAAVVHSA